MDLTGEDDKATQAIKEKEEEEEGDEDGMRMTARTTAWDSP